MDQSIKEFLIALLAAAPGIYALYLKFLEVKSASKKTKKEMEKIESDADKTDAEAASEIGEAWKALLEPYREEVKGLNARLEAVSADNRRLHIMIDKYERVLIGAHRLREQVRLAGGTPVYNPPSKIDD